MGGEFSDFGDDFGEGVNRDEAAEPAQEDGSFLGENEGFERCEGVQGSRIWEVILGFWGLGMKMGAIEVS